MKVYDQLKENSYWKEINADKSVNDLQDEIFGHCNQAIDNISSGKLDNLW